MSAPTNLSDINDLSRDNIEFHYICSFCDNLFLNETEYNNHSNKCNGNTDIVLSNQNKLTLKRKLAIETESEESRNLCPIPSKKSKDAATSLGEVNNYEISSEIINENEVLITLRCNRSSNQISNNLSSEEDNIYTEADITSIAENIIIENDLASSSKTLMIENENIDLDLDDNDKILTVLDPVNLNETQAISVFDLEQDHEDFEYNKEKERYCKQNLLNSKKSFQNKKRCQDNDKEQNAASLNQPNSKMYRIIPPEVNTPPITYGVYDFYDEEEERMKQKKLEEKQKARELRSRTCKFCDTVFDDPIDLLRHKRSHQFSKVLLTKQELEPYLDVADKTKCPLCNKPMGSNRYKTAYMRHIFTHSNEFNFRCRVCELPFRRRDQWLGHEKRHIVPPE